MALLLSLAGCGSSDNPAPTVSTVVYFGAADDTHGWELWKTDGTTTDTVQDKDFSTEVFPEFCGLTGMSCP